MSVNSTVNKHTIVICANMFVRKDGKYSMLRRSASKIDLPNQLHSVGGKIDDGEDPLLAARRELKEEAGLTVKNIRLEAVLTEIMPNDHPLYDTNWLIYYFSGDYNSGALKGTEEGELVWMSPDEIIQDNMFVSLKEIVKHILNPNDGLVFARFVYDKDLHIIDKQINICEK